MPIARRRSPNQSRQTIFTAETARGAVPRCHSRQLIEHLLHNVPVPSAPSLGLLETVDPHRALCAHLGVQVVNLIVLAFRIALLEISKRTC